MASTCVSIRLAAVLFTVLALLFWAPVGAAVAAMLTRGMHAVGVTLDLGWLAAAGGGAAAFLLFALNAIVFASVAVYALALCVQLSVAVVSFYSLVAASMS